MDDIGLKAFLTTLILGAASVQTGQTTGSQPLSLLEKIYNANNWIKTPNYDADFKALKDRINAKKALGEDYALTPTDYLDIGITNIATSVNNTYESHLSIPGYVSALPDSPGQLVIDSSIGIANWEAYKASGMPYTLKWNTYDVMTSADNLSNFCTVAEYNAMDTTTRLNYFAQNAVCTKFSLALYKNGAWDRYAAWRVTVKYSTTVIIKFWIAPKNTNLNVMTSKTAGRDIYAFQNGTTTKGRVLTDTMAQNWDYVKSYLSSYSMYPSMTATANFNVKNIFDVSGTGYLEYVPSLLKNRLDTISGTGTIAIPNGYVVPKDWSIPTSTDTDDPLIVIPSTTGVGSVSIPLPISVPKVGDTTTGDTTKDQTAAVVVPIDPSISIPDARDKIINKIKLPGFDNTINKIKSMDTSRGTPPKVTFNLNAIFNAATSRFSVPQSPFSSGESTLIDFGMLQEYKFMGLPLIDYFRSLVSMGFIIRTFFYVWRKIIPSEVMSS